MNSKENLEYLFQTGQGALKRLLDDISEEESLNGAGGFCNPIRWQAGHLAWCADIMVWLLGGERTFPDKWTATFEYGSKLPENDAVFPPFKEICGKLHELQMRMNSLLDGFDEDKFAEEVELAKDWRMNRLNALHFFCRHDFYHAGQIMILRKQLGRQTAQ